jgi:hypothetical protein
MTVTNMKRTFVTWLVTLGLLLGPFVAPPPAQAQLPGQGVVKVVALVATPVFDASTAQTFVLTLGATTVTSSTLINLSVGQIVYFVISQDATGSRAFVWPTNVGGAPNVLQAASAVTRFSCQFDGAACQALNPVVLQQIAAYSNGTTSATAIPELKFSVAPSRNYSGICYLSWSTSNTAAAPAYDLTGPASPTAVTLQLFTPTTVSAIAAPAGSVAASFGNFVTNPATVTISTQFLDILTFSVQNGTTAGNIQVLMKSTSAAGTVTYSPGSACVVTAQ